MTSTETKIELVTESIEALVLAQVILSTPGHTINSGPIARKNVEDARDVLKRSFRELMTPSLRVLSNDAPQSNPIPPLARPTAVENNFPPFKPKSIDDMHGEGY